jgi:UDP-N-acetyl-D-glucosamine dehydrogenase
VTGDGEPDDRQVQPPASARGKLVVVGQGYVGFPLAMRAVEVGYDVVGLDVDAARVKRLLAGESYIEDVSDAVVQAAIDTGRYHPVTDTGACAGFDVAVITVPTPLHEGSPDLSFVEGAARTLGAHVQCGALVILESTTYPGTTEELVGPLLEGVSGLSAGTDFLLGYSPERIDPGNDTWTFVTTPKVVSGIDEASCEAVQDFYDTLVERTVPVSGTREAELTKLLENTYRHVNIALVNELAVFAGELGVDIWEVIDAASSKPFGYQRFAPGPGVGGHCLPIDPSYLSWRVRRATGHAFRFVELANDINEHMPDYVVRRISAALNRRHLPVNGSRILLLGLAYKKNTSDAREAPALVVAGRLADLGADVRAADPHVTAAAIDARVRRVEATADEVEGADAVVILTDHDAFDLERLVRDARYVFDTRHSISGPNVEHL